ncbi:MAG: aminopeptidase P family protein [Desulfobacteraceae bacterium]|nr:MAG: aminopeptidase P family protein [Desulfobacteraceae bacterium]
MNKSVFGKRTAAFRERLAGLSCDTAWIIQPENRRYLSGFKAEDNQFTELSGSLLINENQCILLTDSRYTSQAKMEAVNFKVHTIKQGLIESLPGVVKRMGTEKLGFEEDYLTWGLHRQLTDGLGALSPPVALEPLNGLVEKMREVKDASEIKAIEASADLMSEILDRVIAGLEPGLTEKEVAWQIEGLAREAGSESLAFPSIVASGLNSALPHAVPTNRKLKKKEPIILDVGLRLDTYRSDMTRTVFLGEPEPEFKKIYSTVRQALVTSLKEIHPGVDSNYPDAIARQIISDAGFGEYFGHGLGHGVGLATHERPRLAPQKPVKLKKGMVVTVEPGIYIPEKGGVRLEEMVVIEADGSRLLTKNDHFYDFMP